MLIRKEEIKMENKDLKVSDVLNMSYELWEKHKNSWAPMEPKYGPEVLLYMFEELGEVIAIIKKKDESDIMKKGKVRDAFLEELSDSIMYFSDVLNRYHVTASEFCEAYEKKIKRNMTRDFKHDHEKFLSD